MYVFIDTNIFLSFYHLTSEDLTELEKLVLLLDSNEIILLLPEQVIDETKRNRASKINDSFTNFKNTKFKLSYPAYCKDYEQYDQIRSNLRTIEKQHSDMVQAIKDDIENHALKADILLEKLFAKALKLERSEAIIRKAERRVSLGNPPGKKDSIGDAVNWEAIIDRAKSKIPLAFVTADSDYCSALDTNKMDEFLVAEWKVGRGKDILFYRTLSDFFKNNYPDINLKTEIEKDAVIEKLAASDSFATTHALISKLSTYDRFTQKQADNLVLALINNNQIGWIISDDDVHRFYKKIDEDKFLAFEDYYDRFKELLALKDKHEIEDDIPF